MIAPRSANVFAIASSRSSSVIRRSSFLFTTRGSLLSFTTARVFRVITRDANRHVDTVSSACWSSGHVHATRVVLQLPPRASLSTLVSLDWRNGTPLTSSPRESDVTICSRNVSDLLMYVASFSAWPVTCVFFTRSEPARSTRWSFATVVRSSPPGLVFLDSTCSVKMQWLRLDDLFRT